MLGSSPSADDLNHVDLEGCSLLYLSLSPGYGKHQPEIINMLLNRGAVIKNGTAGGLLKIPKLLTRHANAENLQYIFKKVLACRGGLQPEDLFLEIGSGEGYLKYLLRLCHDAELSRLIEKIVETETSPEIIRDNRRRGPTGDSPSLPVPLRKPFVLPA
ncbi:MAG: hypothetical protein JXB88_26230 [Spirochaetales bacterium]|nr:hypothetical protein [Spirochaetales bacterium]